MPGIQNQETRNVRKKNCKTSLLFKKIDQKGDLFQQDQIEMGKTSSQKFQNGCSILVYTQTEYSSQYGRNGTKLKTMEHNAAIRFFSINKHGIMLKNDKAENQKSNQLYQRNGKESTRPHGVIIIKDLVGSICKTNMINLCYQLPHFYTKPI